MPQAPANGITLEYEEFGNPGDPPLLLIMGLGMQMIAWPEEFCRSLAGRGFRVIRFDNRDCGLSTSFAHAGVPNIALSYLKFLLHIKLKTAYTIDHMAEDVVGLLDALHVPAAHMVGASMGGMIAQNLTARFPPRVLSLTSIMSSTGNRSLPKSKPRTLKALLQRPAPRSDIPGAIKRLENILRIIGSVSNPENEEILHARCERHVRRSYRPDGMARQLLAIAAADDRSAIVKTIARPTLVIHGDEDPLLLPECGHETARLIPGAGLKIISGMGHDLPTVLLPRLVEEIAGHCVHAAGK